MAEIKPDLKNLRKQGGVSSHLPDGDSQLKERVQCHDRICSHHVSANIDIIYRLHQIYNCFR